MATGRFTFHKRHLYFSLVIPSPEADASSATVGVIRPPRYLQFLSEDGNILEEQELTTNDYYNATGKVDYHHLIIFKEKPNKNIPKLLLERYIIQ
jgi:hypothetical protein